MIGWQVLCVEALGPEPTEIPPLSGPTVLVFPADATGDALAGATAVVCGAEVLGRITHLSVAGDRVEASRSSHGGRIAIRVSSTKNFVIATANTMPACDGEITLGAESPLTLEREVIVDQAVALEGAPIVLAGGRGLDEASFAQLEKLAALLKGAVGASLPAIDLGLAPVSRQVGQSGKFVTPRIYLAAGLSGTPQHLAGIGSATRLLAINSDAEASIFRYSESGVVGDARIILPKLVKAVERKLAQCS